MEILFYRYNSICEPDLITAFQRLGITVVEETTQITQKKVSGSQIVDSVSGLIKKHTFLFIFSVNFFPALSDICDFFQIPYICWTVDVPVLELFSTAIKNKCNRIFLFDRSQYLYFRERNPEGIFYLPLATNVERWEKIISGATEAERRAFEADVSFVGSLYGEKNRYRQLKGLSEFAKGYVSGLVEAQLQLYGVNIVETSLSDELMAEMDKVVPDMHQPLYGNDRAAQRYMIAHSYIGYEIAQVERLRLLNALAEHYNVNLYTRSDTAGLVGVNVHGGVKTLTEMPIIFRESSINLNITMRPIATGLSLRVFDVCGCGGFLLTNWQEELPELYEPGLEVEYFTSQEELLDKADYYLKHDDERRTIAIRGYERTKREHTYDIRIAEMIRIVNGTL